MRKRRWSTVLVVLGLVLICGSQAVFAVGLDPRSAGMGGAYLAVSDDATSLYWNPANLARVQKFSFVTAGTGYMIGHKGFVDFCDKYYNNDTNSFEFVDENAIDVDATRDGTTQLEKDIDKILSDAPKFEGKFFSGVAYKGFGAGLIADAKAYVSGQYANIDGDDDEEFKLNLDADGKAGIILGYGYQVRPDISIGASMKTYVAGKRVRAAVNSGTYSAQDLLEDENNYETDTVEADGKGVTFDLGVLYNATPKISVAAVLRDVGSISWDQTEHKYKAFGTDAEVSLNDLKSEDESLGRIDLGVAYYYSPELLAAFDIADHGVHMGVEYKVNDYVALRGGLFTYSDKGATFTLGTGLKYNWFRTDVALGFSDGLNMASGSIAIPF